MFFWEDPWAPIHSMEQQPLFHRNRAQLLKYDGVCVCGGRGSWDLPTRFKKEELGNASFARAVHGAASRQGTEQSL